MTSNVIMAQVRRAATSHVWSLLTIVLLVASVSLNVIQATRIGGLRSVIRTLRGEAQLAVGTSVPPMAVHDLRGQPTEVRFDGVDTPTVVYVFSPTCGWCARNLNNIKTLADQAGGRYRFVGVSLVEKDLQTYVERSGLTFPVFMKPDASSLKAFKLGGTPETVVVAPDGRVLKVWPGAFSEASHADVERFFKVVLPGLTQS